MSDAAVGEERLRSFSWSLSWLCIPNQSAKLSKSRCLCLFSLKMASLPPMVSALSRILRNPKPSVLFIRIESSSIVAQMQGDSLRVKRKPAVKFVAWECRTALVKTSWPIRSRLFSHSCVICRGSPSTINFATTGVSDVILVNRSSGPDLSCCPRGPAERSALTDRRASCKLSRASALARSRWPKTFAGRLCDIASPAASSWTITPVKPCASVSWTLTGQSISLSDNRRTETFFG